MSNAPPFPQENKLTKTHTKTYTQTKTHTHKIMVISTNIFELIFFKVRNGYLSIKQ